MIFIPVVFYTWHLVLIIAAIIPAVFLLRFVYKSDRLEKESPVLIRNLLILGVVSTFLAIVMERVGSFILNIVFQEETVLYKLLLYFLVVGFSEEFAKYTVLKKFTWDSPEFNCKYDGVVYAATVSLGFALYENIGYVLNYGLSTALVRAITAVPGHACFGVFMGIWYGLAKRWALREDENASKLFRYLSVIVPAFIHGCYDFILSLNSSNSSFVFVVFVGAMFAVSFIVIKRLSSHDQYL